MGSQTSVVGHIYQWHTKIISIIQRTLISFSICQPPLKATLAQSWCDLCSALHSDNSTAVISDLSQWWDKEAKCVKLCDQWWLQGGTPCDFWSYDGQDGNYIVGKYMTILKPYIETIQ